MKEKTPKSPKGNRIARFHQSLTEDIGHPALSAQITQIVTLFQVSDNMKQMWAQFNKLKRRQSRQLELPFDFDDDGLAKVIKNEVNDDVKMAAERQQFLTNL